MTVKTTTIDLLRHGQCEGGEIFRGSTDVPLTDKGWQQMQQAVHESSPWQRVVSSSLRRCRLFAEQLAEEKTLAVESHDALREIHFGDWEGQLQETVQREQGEQLRAFWQDPLSNTPPNGEPLVDFHRRVSHCFNSLLQQYQGEHLLLVSHGAVIRVLICELLNMPLDSIASISVPYACLTRFRVYHLDKKPDWAQLCFHRGE